MLTRRPRPWVLAPAVASLVLASVAVSALDAQNTAPATNAAANPFTKVSKWTPPPLPAGKKAITQDTYDEWRGISGSTLSGDGKWAVFTVSPVVGEGEFVVRSTSSATEYKVPRGYTGRPQLQAGATGGGFNVQAAQISPDNKYVAFLIYPGRAEVEAARVRRGTPQPRNTLGIMNLADGVVTKVPSVRSFKMGADGGQFIAYQLEDSTASANAAGAGRGGRGGAPGAAPGGAARDTTRAAGPRRTYGSDVVLRDLVSGTETRIAGVTNFIFDESGKTFAYSVTTRDSVNNGVFVRKLADGTVTTLISGIATYRGLGFNRAGNQVVFASDLGDVTKSPKFAVYHASLVPAKGKTIAARRIISSSEAPEGMMVAENGRLDFTREGNAVVFSFGFIPQDSIPADSLTDKAVYDLWHWKEPTIQTQQRLSAGRDRNRTHLAVYQLATNKWTRLGNDSLAQVTLSDDGKRALALNSLEYAIEQFWGEGGADVYLIDATSGSRTPIRKKLRRGAQLSTGGNFVTWFDDNHWYSHNIATGKTVDLTRGISSINFHDETFDSPDVPPPYGIAGWTSGDKRVLINDRFDVWEVDPMGVAAPRNITDGEGRKAGMTFRVVNLDRDERFLDPAKALMLRAVDTLTKASGYWRDKLGVDARPERILMADTNITGLQKAKDAEQFLLTQSTYREYPDLWTGSSLASLTKISNANPQDSQYPRGSVELVSWYNSDGIPLRGLLYKPENFDPAKQYPMVVYFYETLTDGLHNYVSPTGRNVVNPLVYNSQGYLVFEPDTCTPMAIQVRARKRQSCPVCSHSLRRASSIRSASASRVSRGVDTRAPS